ncbi:hypothetical protein CONLIGDRAFT_708394 [Coniochaeta ligniaria NRRL 30616]|uniref:Protein HRI1 n=1 Tax=Coniochaeta ligniaria NRRL 30616 TaxID=1408157 RepID=A0A1J7IDC5_9PEZI|nr:hypothetical protein CONLIGDRAFT_708394 [Coniochaeta ligniaria NRRL 30616]
MADISLRESIRWLPDSPSEPTSTVVLTSPDKHFVDVRILLPLDHPQGILTKDQLDWAFAGRSESAPREMEAEANDNGERIRCGTHSVWKHWVDSRTREAEGVVDEGDMVDLPGGRTLETGSMVNPATGRVTGYEEVWGSGAPLGGMEGVVVVLRTEDGECGRRGVVVRVAQYVQGILRDGDRVMVQRREWREGDVREQKVKLGGTVAGGGIVWDVVELDGDQDGVVP